MAFDWSTGVSVAGSVLGGIMGGSKAAERAAKDAAALQNQRITESILNSQAQTQPFLNTGLEANRLLSQYLGIDTSGYAPRPTRDQAAAEVRSLHFAKYGKDYGRNSDMGWVEQKTDEIYQKRLADWEKGLEQYKIDNEGKMGDGRLLREFTNADFVKDPGYNFRMAEGEKGINRAMVARGGYDSGTALKALNRYNQDFASNEFGNAFNRDAANKQQIYQMLSGQSGQGLSAAQTQGNMAIGAATQASNNAMNTANNAWQAQLNRDENRANSVQSALGNLVYGIRRGNQSVVSTPPFNPDVNQTGAYPGAYYA